MNLYRAPGACSLALYIALRELGLAVDMRTLTYAELARMIGAHRSARPATGAQALCVPIAGARG